MCQRSICCIYYILVWGTFHVYLPSLCPFYSVIIRWTGLYRAAWITTELKQREQLISVHKGYFNGKFSSILKYWDPFDSWITLWSITNGKSPLWMGGYYWRKRQRKGKHFFCCVWHFLDQAMFSFRVGYFFLHEGKIKENRSSKTRILGVKDEKQSLLW